MPDGWNKSHGKSEAILKAYKAKAKRLKEKMEREAKTNGEMRGL